MRKKRRQDSPNIHESFSDIALLMLATFIFLLVTILITSKLANEIQIPELKAKVSALEKELQGTKERNQRLLSSMESVSALSTEAQITNALSAAGLGEGQGKKDFDLFIKGLRQLPGKDLHLMVDASGSMHGVTDFLIPVLRVITIRSGKHLSAITWFSDGRAETYTGSMGAMLDQLMAGAPFQGSDETIGWGFRRAAENAPAPGAYLLIGDEPSTDRILFREIPAPVYTLPIGKSDPDTNWQYQLLADETHGRMMHLEFK